jgi:hypothetical protein
MYTYRNGERIVTIMLMMIFLGGCTLMLLCLNVEYILFLQSRRKEAIFIVGGKYWQVDVPWGSDLMST